MATVPIFATLGAAVLQSAQTASFIYVSDDGNTYQLSTLIERAVTAAGALAPASGSEPLFPALRVPRHLRCAPAADSHEAQIRVVCNTTNPAWLAGPGAVVTVGGVAYVVGSCQGEVSLG